jgi:hypothetical protein
MTTASPESATPSDAPWRPVSKRFAALEESLLDRFGDEPNVRAYVQDRYARRLSAARKISRRAEFFFVYGRWFVVAGAAVSPTLLTLGTEVGGDPMLAFKIAGIVLSLLVAVIGAGLAAWRASAHWRLYRTLRKQLEGAGWKWVAKPGPKEDFACFVSEVEAAVLEFEDRYQEEVAVIEKPEGG